MLKNVVEYGQVAATAVIRLAFLGMIATVMFFDNRDET